jgi:hypothetical protein
LLLNAPATKISIAYFWLFDTEISPYGIKTGHVVPVGTLSKRFDLYHA